MGRRPRIVLTTGKPSSPAAVRSRDHYIDALDRAGADVIVVEPGDAVPEDFDGLCLSGGPDIAPERYGETDQLALCERVDPARDATEFEAASAALERDVPVLGICRGFQLLNVARGGGLVLDMKEHRVEGDDVILHQGVVVDPDSRLARACGTAPLSVNSRHHQAVTAEKLGRELRPTARVGEYVEAFESDAHRWVVGVQWHPERTIDAGMSDEVGGVFDAFVKEAARTTSAAR